MPVNLTVDEHLRVISAYLSTVQSAARLIEQPTVVPGFESPAYFATWVSNVATVMHAHVGAVRRTLPVDYAATEAPFARGGAR